MARRILLVANQTATGGHLRDVVRQRLAQGPCSFMLLVPATEPHGGWTSIDAASYRKEAESRMQEAIAGLRELGADVAGWVEEGSPTDAIAALMQKERFHGHAPFEEIVVSTLPPGASRWLRQDLPHRLARRYKMPVTHVIGESTPAHA
jgi:hypothetical protein